MNFKTLPCSEVMLQRIASEYGTPFHLYDERGIRTHIRRLKDAFSWHHGFKEYFAIKANPNPFLLEILREEGCGADCSSMAELVLAKAVGWRRDEIIFSSNNTPITEYEQAYNDGVIINIDDISHLPLLEEKNLLPDFICFRYNPGQMDYGNDIIGLPSEAKYGMTKNQIKKAISFAANRGTEKIGLHTMIVSNELNIDSLVATAEMMFKLAVEIYKEQGIKVAFIDLGGGIGIPYKPGEKAVDYGAYGERIEMLYHQILESHGLKDVMLALECGRVMTGPYGWLITKAIHYKNTYKQYIGVDACMADLMRPALYGAYHHITVLGKNETEEMVYDIVGSLCENNDKFAIDRKMPAIEMGDILVIHDTGAHGYAMGFNYNGKLKSPEFLLQKDGEVKLIRRGETLADYFATVNYPGL